MVLGKAGIGKTWAVKHALDPHIELTAEILRSKNDTTDFLEKIRSSHLPVILDEYEAIQDLVGLRELTGPPTKGVFVVTSCIPPKFDFEFVTYDFPVMTPEQIKRIVPNATERILDEAKGDIRWVIQCTKYASDSRDEFYGSRDFIMGLVCTGGQIRPVDHIGSAITEPGNASAILHANYIDAPRGRVDLAAVSDMFSTADVFEDRVYAGDWGLFPFWNFFGCIMPAAAIGHTLKPPLKPGATWTKHQNMCMRHKKIQTMARRNAGRELSLDELNMLRFYAEREIVEPLKEYGLTPQDVDVLSNLSPMGKFKPKIVSNLKKSLA